MGTEMQHFLWNAGTFPLWFAMSPLPMGGRHSGSTYAVSTPPQPCLLYVYVARVIPDEVATGTKAEEAECSKWSFLIRTSPHVR